VRSLVVLVTLLSATSARAEVALPAPLGVDDVVGLARGRRAEIVAARANARAVAERPAIVSALPEPMVSVSIDHWPFDMGDFDRSATIEQSFPLSRVRGHRERAARADARRARANADRVVLDVELDAARAFWMLAEVRASQQIAERQHQTARQLVAAATARYASNTGAQADVLRAQIEVARLEAERRALAADVRGAEVMLNTSLARAADAPIPALDATVADAVPPAGAAIAHASRTRPELRAGAAEVERAEAEARVMRSMFRPMATVKVGPSYTMMEGYGWMAMVGISIPLWRGKLHAGVAEANAMSRMSAAELEAMRRMAEGEARAAREAVVAARERYLALRDEIVPRSQQVIAPALAAYAAGQLPLVSVVEAVQATWSAERELAMRQTELGIAWARLRRATGEEVRR